ncbi:hypothetical protein BASA82_000283 [Batrachochytrium salamandrivorans]|nr:hypothetical protein BASA82_000283 [Batrachochytrium salamandrivorans]
MKYQDPLAAMVKEHKLTHHDLHAHLLGCGDHRFWVDDMMHLYLPKRYSFFGKGTTPHVGRFPPLIFFDEEEKEFFPYEETLEFLDLLENDLKGSGGGILKQIHEVLRFLEDLKKGILKQIYEGLFDDAESQKNFVDFFKDGIEYDVVYSVKNLALGLCLDGEDNEIRKSHICEILECHLEDFKMALVFNARKQQFQRVEGITNSKLLQILQIKNGHAICSKWFFNAFTRSHGHNEAWKVDYMELSIGVGDASKRHIMAFLAEKIMSKTKLKKALLRETTSKLFQQPGTTTTFRYLAGFNRGKVHLPLGPPILFDTALPQIIPKSSTVETPNDSQKCWKLMKTYPHHRINLFNESLSDGNFFSDFKGMFKGCIRISPILRLHGLRGKS